jgi:hypothetical protein
MHTHRRKHAPDPWQSKSESLIKQHRQCKKIHWPASFERHHLGIPGGLISLYPGGIVRIRIIASTVFAKQWKTTSGRNDDEIHRGLGVF